MAAVYRANKTGEGQFVDVAMYDAVLAFCERIVYQYSYTGDVPGPEGNAHPLLCPFGSVPGPRRTRRDRVPVGSVLGDRSRARWDAPIWSTTTQYRTNEARVAHNAEVVALISAWTSTQTKAQLKASLGGARAVRTGARRRRHLRRPARPRARHAASTSSILASIAR